MLRSDSMVAVHGSTAVLQRNNLSCFPALGVADVADFVLDWLP